MGTRAVIGGLLAVVSVFVGRPLTVVLLLIALAAFIVPNMPALTGWRREHAGASDED